MWFRMTLWDDWTFGTGRNWVTSPSIYMLHISGTAYTHAYLDEEMFTIIRGISTNQPPRSDREK